MFRKLMNLISGLRGQATGSTVGDASQQIVGSTVGGDITQDRGS
ncbi:hypothetical protein SAMN05444392_104168 [Seinonella peptonophila]|uniref:Uncharacterized protein n=1 Tax=Seinonella peptonophila TaxID=112248 RepID=A0A1M4X760_9BACL|nr:hypothetical protein SAMN05444392_104168 [Seinonella peptonophila]